MILLAELSTQVLFLAGVVLVAVFILRRSAKGVSNANRSSQRSVRASSSASAADPTESQSYWEVHMHELSRDLSGQLDSKIMIVQQLLLKSEQMAARLELAVDAARREGLLPRENPSDLPAATAPIVDGSTVLAKERGEAYRLADAGLPAAKIAEKLSCKLGEIELLLSLRSKVTK